MTRRTDAHRKADKRYREKLVRVALDFHRDDATLMRLDKLAERYGSRKAVVVAGIEALED